MLATMRCFIILTLFCLVGWSNSQECPAKYIRFSLKHTFCIAPNPACEISRTGVSPEDKEVILRVHNEFRSKVAMGNERRTKDNKQLPQSADMMQLEWDDELATVAQKWSENCLFEHDCNECRLVENFAVGQNLAIENYDLCKGGKCPDPSNDPDWTTPITGLYDEVKDYHTSWLSSYESHPGPMTGHFTQLIWSTSWKIGCGYSYYKHGGIFHKFYACNYGPGGNLEEQHVYKEGQPCSACPTNTQCSTSTTGANTYPGLCKMNDPNTSPAYRVNTQDLLFYCGVSSSDSDCQYDVSGDGTFQTVNSVGGNYYLIAVNGGQSTTVTFNNPITPQGDRFCFELTFRKGPLDASVGDQSSLQANYEFDNGFSASPTNLELHSNVFNSHRININWGEKTKLSLTFSVPSNAGEHVLELRRIMAFNGPCALRKD